MAIDEMGVVKAFLERRNELLGTNYRITAKPDELNRGDKDVDAIAEADKARPLAIEHTSLETFRNQIRDNDWFDRWVAPLEILGHRYDPWWVGLTFVYWRGKRWGAELLGRVSDWLDVNLDRVPVQQSGRNIYEYEIPDVGTVRISKHKNSSRPGLYIARTVPTNVAFPKEGVEIVMKALGHKYRELATYKERGHVSVLLLESRDIALTNHVEQYKAFLRACREDDRPELDEVWVADVFDGPKEQFVDFLSFRADKAVMELANPPNFMLGPEHQDYWESVLANDDRD